MTAYGRPKLIFYSLLMKPEGGSWGYAKMNGKVWETTSKAEANAAAKQQRQRGYEVKVRTRSV